MKLLTSFVGNRQIFNQLSHTYQGNQIIKAQEKLVEIFKDITTVHAKLSGVMESLTTFVKLGRLAVCEARFILGVSKYHGKTEKLWEFASAEKSKLQGFGVFFSGPFEKKMESLIAMEDT